MGGETTFKEDRSTIINPSLEKSSEIQAAESAAAGSWENHANRAVGESKGGRSLAMASAAGAMKEVRIPKNTRKTGEGMQTGLPNQQQFFLPLQVAKRIERGSENLRKVIGSPLS